MIPITSSAGCELWYMLWSRTTCPLVDARERISCAGGHGKHAMDVHGVKRCHRLADGCAALALVRGFDRDSVPVQMPDRRDDLAGNVDVPVPMRIGEARGDRVLGVAALIDVEPDRL